MSQTRLISSVGKVAIRSHITSASENFVIAFHRRASLSLQQAIVVLRCWPESKQGTCWFIAFPLWWLVIVRISVENETYWVGRYGLAPAKGLSAITMTFCADTCGWTERFLRLLRIDNLLYLNSKVLCVRLYYSHSLDTCTFTNSSISCLLSTES